MKKTAIILSVLIIIGCLGYIAYDKITDYMVKKTLTIVAEDETLKAQIEAAMENMEIAAPVETPKSDAEPATPENTETPSETPKTDAQGRQAASFPTAPPQTPKPKKSSDGLSMDDLKGSDKSYVMSIYSRFTASEISTVSGMLSGGLTVEEKRAIKKIVYAKVSGAEIDRLYAIARKYQ